MNKIAQALKGDSIASVETWLTPLNAFLYVEMVFFEGQKNVIRVQISWIEGVLMIAQDRKMDLSVSKLITKHLLLVVKLKN